MKLLNGIIFILCLAMISFSSCGGDEEVSGCTDSRAENYNSNATSDDGSCIFPNEKFLGMYTGNFQCAGLLSAINTDNAEYEISENSDPNVKDKVTVTVNVVDVGLFSFEADVDGNKLTFSELELNDFTVDLGPPLGEVSADLTITGEAEISGNTIMATLNITVDAGVTVADQCTLVGTKL